MQGEPELSPCAADVCVTANVELSLWNTINSDLVRSDLVLKGKK